MQKIEQPFLKAVKQTLDERCNETIEEIYKIAIKLIIETIADGYGDDSPSKSAQEAGSAQPPSGGSNSGGPSDGSNNPPSNGGGRAGGAGSSSLAPTLHVGAAGGACSLNKNGSPNESCVSIENNNPPLCGNAGQTKFGSCETGSEWPAHKVADPLMASARSTFNGAHQRQEWAAPAAPQATFGSPEKDDHDLQEGGGAGLSVLVAGKQEVVVDSDDEHEQHHLNSGNERDACPIHVSLDGPGPTISALPASSIEPIGAATGSDVELEPNGNGTARLRDTLSVLRELLLLLMARKTNAAGEEQPVSGFEAGSPAHSPKKRRLEIIGMENKRRTCSQQQSKSIEGSSKQWRQRLRLRLRHSKLPTSSRYNERAKPEQPNGISGRELASGRVTMVGEAATNTTIVSGGGGGPSLNGFGQLELIGAAVGRNARLQIRNERNASRCEASDAHGDLAESGGSTPEEEARTAAPSGVICSGSASITLSKQVEACPMAPQADGPHSSIGSRLNRETGTETGGDFERTVSKLKLESGNNNAEPRHQVYLAEFDDPQICCDPSDRAGFELAKSADVIQPADNQQQHSRLCFSAAPITGSLPNSTSLAIHTKSRGSGCGDTKQKWQQQKLEPTNRDRSAPCWPNCSRPFASFPCETDTHGRRTESPKRAKRVALKGCLATYNGALRADKGGPPTRAIRDNGTVESCSRGTIGAEKEDGGGSASAHSVGPQHYQEASRSLSARDASSGSQIKQSSSPLSGNEQIRAQTCTKETTCSAHLQREGKQRWQLVSSCQRLASARKGSQFSFVTTKIKSRAWKRRPTMSKSKDDSAGISARRPQSAICSPLTSIPANSKSTKTSRHKFTLTSDIDDLTELIKMLMLTMTTHANTSATAHGYNLTANATIRTSSTTTMPAADGFNEVPKRSILQA